MLDLKHATMTTEVRAIVTVRGYGFCPDVILDRFRGAQFPNRKWRQGTRLAKTLISLRRRRLSHVRVRSEKWRSHSQLLKKWLKQCFVSRRTEKKEQRKHHQLAQIIKVINTLAILFIVIPELTKFRTTNCLGHLHIVRMPLVCKACRSSKSPLGSSRILHRVHRGKVHLWHYLW